MFCLVEGLDAGSWRRRPGRSLIEKESSITAEGVHLYSLPFGKPVAAEALHRSASKKYWRSMA